MNLHQHALFPFDTLTPNGPFLYESLYYPYHGHSEAVHTVAWSPDGKYIASGSSDTTVKIWQVATGRNLYTHRGHLDTVRAVAWCPDSQSIASASDDQTVQVWQAI